MNFACWHAPRNPHYFCWGRGGEGKARASALSFSWIWMSQRFIILVAYYGTLKLMWKCSLIIDTLLKGSIRGTDKIKSGKLKTSFLKVSLTCHRKVLSLRSSPRPLVLIDVLVGVLLASLVPVGPRQTLRVSLAEGYLFQPLSVARMGANQSSCSMAHVWLVVPKMIMTASNIHVHFSPYGPPLTVSN